MDEIDIWRAADNMVVVYGEDADLHAAMRADVAHDKGDTAGEHLWDRVTQAILALARFRPRASKSLN